MKMTSSASWTELKLGTTQQQSECMAARNSAAPELFVSE